MCIRDRGGRHRHSEDCPTDSGRSGYTAGPPELPSIVRPQIEVGKGQRGEEEREHADQQTPSGPVGTDCSAQLELPLLGSFGEHLGFVGCISHRVVSTHSAAGRGSSTTLAGDEAPAATSTPSSPRSATAGAFSSL